VVAEDYRLAAALVALSVVFFVAPQVPAGFFGLLGVFLAFQTLRIRFVFDDDAFEVKTKPLDALFEDAPLTDTGENFVVGGENRWTYDSFVNWDFFPSESLPVLVYFKETQTPAADWDVGPGKWANSDEALARGAVKGQVHFFPCIAKAGELKENFKANKCAKLP
jgi:NIMA (never in mitosis gene a)-related kinase